MFEPLCAVADKVRYHPAYQFFEVADFMVMAKVIRSSRPHVTEFKHVYTRRYPHLDALGNAYRFVPASISGNGRFLRARSLEWALDSLRLWELPWFKPELAKYRFDLPYEHSWRLQPRFDPRRFLIDEIAPPTYDDDDPEWWRNEPPADAEPARPPLRLVSPSTSDA